MTHLEGKSASSFMEHVRKGQRSASFGCFLSAQVSCWGNVLPFLSGRNIKHWD